MKVKFLRDVVYETEGIGKGPRFRKDQTYDLRDDLAQRWLRRQAAETVEEQAPDAAASGDGRKDVARPMVGPHRVDPRPEQRAEPPVGPQRVEPPKK